MRRRIELPVLYCAREPDLDAILKPFWQGLPPAVNRAGGAFWLTVA